jgi:hypothetical protein
MISSMGISAQGAEHLTMNIGRAYMHVREFDSLVVAHCTRSDLFTATGRNDIKNGVLRIVRVPCEPTRQVKQPRPNAEASFFRRPSPNCEIICDHMVHRRSYALPGNACISGSGAMSRGQRRQTPPFGARPLIDPLEFVR